jgi:hypothetical protein
MNEALFMFDQLAGPLGKAGILFACLSLASLAVAFAAEPGAGDRS